MEKNKGCESEKYISLILLIKESYSILYME